MGGDSGLEPVAAQGRRAPRLVAVAAVFALAVFGLDLWLPLGVAVPSLYLGVVLLGLWARRRHFAVVAAAACGVLTVLAPFVFAGGRPPAWIEALNRPLMLVPLLLGALLVSRYKTVARRLAEQEARAAQERRLAETERWRRESLARMGEMAAVVAHEVRNPLAGIKGVLQVVGQRLAPESGDRRALQQATLRLDSLQGLTEELLLFARPRPPEPAPLGLLALARETAELLRSDPGLDGLSVEVRGEAGELRGDPQQLRTVVLNLLRNAAEAAGAQEPRRRGRPRPGRVGRAARGGRGAGRARGPAGEGVRALLHHAGAGHRPRAGDRAARRGSPRRRGRVRDCSGRRGVLPGSPPARAAIAVTGGSGRQLQASARDGPSVTTGRVP